MALTKEQWQQIEDELSCTFGSVKLRCDGYQVRAAVEPQKKLKFTIAIYVDGWIKGEWADGKDERGLKFYCEKKGYLFPAKQREEARTNSKRRILSPEMRRKWKEMSEKRYSFLTPYWTNPAAFCRHIRKTCQSVELVSVGYEAE